MKPYTFIYLAVVLSFIATLGAAKAAPKKAAPQNVVEAVPTPISTTYKMAPTLYAFALGSLPFAKPVKNRILKGYGELSHCYKEYLATNPVKKSGNVRIDWQITTSGKPVSPQVVITDFTNKPFESCLTQKIAAWSFPEPVVKKYVEHTLV